mgnify:CR=1 FL=1
MTTAATVDAETIREAARGRWRSMIYPALGIDVGNGKHVPCPHCGGKDRFRCDDKDGVGSWYCNQCDPHAGDGFALVMKLRGCDFPEALQLVADVLGLSPPSQQDKGNGHGPGPKKIGKTYEYVDESGNLLYQTVRYVPKDFRQRRPDGKGGWIWNLEGVQLVLYRLPEALQALLGIEHRPGITKLLRSEVLALDVLDAFDHGSPSFDSRGSVPEVRRTLHAPRSRIRRASKNASASRAALGARSAPRPSAQLDARAPGRERLEPCFVARRRRGAPEGRERADGSLLRGVRAQGRMSGGNARAGCSHASANGGWMQLFGSSRRR